MKFDIRGHRFSIFHKKIRKSYGLCSKLKNGLHILLFDIDEVETTEEVRNAICDHFEYVYKPHKVSIYKTENGFHVIVWVMMELRYAACALLQNHYSDLVYVGLGVKRGWWYLERKDIVIPKAFRKLIQFLMVERGKRRVVD